jgi:hypothetical protein
MATIKPVGKTKSMVKALLTTRAANIANKPNNGSSGCQRALSHVPGQCNKDQLACVMNASINSMSRATLPAQACSSARNHWSFQG